MVQVYVFVCCSAVTFMFIIVLWMYVTCSHVLVEVSQQE